MDKWQNNRAWFMVLPVFVVVAISAIIPLMTVVNYSVQDIFAPGQSVFVGTEWFKEVLTDRRLHDALWRQFLFSGLVLVIEIAARRADRAGHAEKARLDGVADAGPAGPAAADPVERDRHHLDHLHAARHRLFGARPSITLGIPFDHTAIAAGGLDHRDADGGLALDAAGRAAGLCRPAGHSRRLFPGRASIDGASAWAVFRYIQLPKMRGVLTIAVLLRFMDSFLIYAEPFVLTGGGPGNSTTFLSIHLVKIAVGQFDLGPAAAFSIIYFLIVLLFSWLFYQALLRAGTGEKR